MSELLFPEDQISALKVSSIVKRDGRVVSFNVEKIVDSIYRAACEVGSAQRDMAVDLMRAVMRVVTAAYPQGAVPTVEEVQDIVERVLVESGHYHIAKAYILYRAEHARLREEKDEQIIVENYIPYKVLWQVFRWNVDHECDTIERINRHIYRNSLSELIVDAEEAYHLEIASVADRISRQGDTIRMIIVAGPSSSGKTTATMKLGEELKRAGKSIVTLEVDNYFKNLSEQPRDEYGDYDFENPDALDLPLINEHVAQLLRGETIMMPYYDFKTGVRTLNATPFSMKKDEVLLIDSLHGLYPDMTAAIPHEMKFKFYIETLCQLRDASGEFIRWADLRMMRRMVRDSWHRSYNPERTVGHWHYVRRSEMRYIVPYINKVDYVFNGAMAYELPLYRRYLWKNMPDIIAAYEKDPKKIDALMRARRVMSILRDVERIEDESVIPLDSPVREFIGGSSYTY